MKLSEIITHITDFSNHPEGVDYLLISKYETPHITIIRYFTNNNDDKMIFKSDKVNMEYLEYYLIMNMKLLKKGGNVTRNENGYDLDHLTPEYIGNIEIKTLPPIEVQETLLESIRKIYDMDIDLTDEEINKLFNINFDIINNNLINNKYYGGSELFKITNVTLFFKNVLKGICDKNINECIEIIKPDIIMVQYLIYYLHYNKSLLDLTNYKYYEFDINEFHGESINMKLPCLEDQQTIVSNIEGRHKLIMELKVEKKESKLFLRNMISDAWI
jgi:hypothetical protein